MPTAIALGDIVKVRTYCFNAAPAGQISVNTTYWKATTLTGAPAYTAQDVAVKWDTLVAPKYKTLLSTLSVYYGVSAQRFRPTPLELTYNTISSMGAGTGGASLLPTQSSPVISFKTDEAKTRGRNYLPFPYADGADPDGTPTAAYLVLIANLITVYQGGIVMAGHGMDTTILTQVVYRAQKPPLPAPPPPVIVAEKFLPVVAWTQADKYGTQRRRGNYGRVNGLPF